MLGCVAVVLLLTTGCAADSAGRDGPAQQAGTSTTEMPETTPAEPQPELEPRPSAGCGTSAAQSVVEQEQTVTVDGAPRRYLVTVPSAHDGDAPLPIVFDFHGLSEESIAARSRASLHAG